MKVPVLKPRDLIKVLEKLNCFKKRQTGSHLIFYCPKQKKIIPVPIHPKDLKKGIGPFYSKRIRFIDSGFSEVVKRLLN
jgi:predicted RNA binding protein YcfA (HicA-like mRNA interferase family)